MKEMLHVHISPTRSQSVKAHQWASKMMEKESCKLGHPNRVTGRMTSSEFQCSGVCEIMFDHFCTLHYFFGRRLSKWSASVCVTLCSNRVFFSKSLVSSRSSTCMTHDRVGESRAPAQQRKFFFCATWFNMVQLVHDLRLRSKYILSVEASEWWWMDHVDTHGGWKRLFPR